MYGCALTITRRQFPASFETIESRSSNVGAPGSILSYEEQTIEI